MGMRGAENEISILPRGSLFRFGPGFLEDFLRFPIATLWLRQASRDTVSYGGFTRPLADPLTHGHVIVPRCCT